MYGYYGSYELYEDIVYGSGVRCAVCGLLEEWCIKKLCTVAIVQGYGSIMNSLVWCGVVWCGVVWCDMVWCGVVYSKVWCGVVSYSAACAVWCGVVWYGVV